MKTDKDQLVYALRHSDTEFRPPVTDVQWDDFEQNNKVTIGLDCRSLYEIGNGFVNYDEGSQIRLWSIQEISDDNDV